MAVADDEQRGLRENLESAEAEIREQDAEIASLRAELATANKIAHQNLWHYRNAVATIERVRNALDDTTGTHADAVERAYEALDGFYEAQAAAVTAALEKGSNGETL